MKDTYTSGMKKKGYFCIFTFLHALISLFLHVFIYIYFIVYMYLYGSVLLSCQTKQNSKFHIIRYVCFDLGAA